MIYQSEFSAIAALDLVPIKAKLMCEDDGEGWTVDQANAVEFEYRRFLCLAKKFPHEPTAPLVDVDTFWHYHILDTIKYAADCETVFGYFLHHIPHAGTRGKEDQEALERMGERMRFMYEETFGDSHVRTIADDGAQLENIRGSKVAQTAYWMVARRADAPTAYCMVAPKAGAQTAYCMVAPQADAQTAYCMIGRKADAQTAYCMVGRKADARTAYCIVARADDGAPTGPLTRQTAKRDDNAQACSNRPALATV